MVHRHFRIRSWRSRHRYAEDRKAIRDLRCVKSDLAPAKVPLDMARREGEDGEVLVSRTLTVLYPMVRSLRNELPRCERKT